jgi:pimeloyl-ACP methyl ester carboxylesterase
LPFLFWRKVVGRINLGDIMRLSPFLLMLAVSSAALANEDKAINLDTRQGVTVALYAMKRDGASAAVVLLPGGSGNIGIKNGVPTSENFLVRSRDYFTGSGFNVTLVGKPTDVRELDYAARVSPEHVEDLRKVVAAVKKESRLPVWLVGTSRGTVSAAAAAIAFGNEELAGIVLTSSVTSPKRTGAVPSQRLEAIRIPVLVMHHERDGCAVTRPKEAVWIFSGLKNAPVKKQVMVDGGANPTGDPCEALHWHGYIGMEREAVDIIADWIKNPKP